MAAQSRYANKSYALHEDDWITRIEAAARLGVTPHAISRLVEGGHLTTRIVPNTHPKILAGDVERLAANAIRPARIS
jgi:hypothetical protein